MGGFKMKVVIEYFDGEYNQYCTVNYINKFELIEGYGFIGDGVIVKLLNDIDAMKIIKKSED
jgi:hypothetical protein